MFEKLEYGHRVTGDIKATRSLGDCVLSPAMMSFLAIGQEKTPFPGSRRGIGIETRQVACAEGQTRVHVPVGPGPEVFFRAAIAAFGPKKTFIWSVEHGHQAAISIHKFLP